jgi:diguanylate cyclase (GGDEF)-like protein/PAS domain S-box-containing protein
MATSDDIERGVLDILKDVAADRGEDYDDLEVVLDAIGEPVYALDADRTLVYYNKACAKAFGVEGDEAVGISATRFSTEESFEEAAGEVNRMVADAEEERETVDVRLKTTGDPPRVFEHSLTPYVDDEGRYRGLVGVAKEVTEVVEVRGELEDDRRALRELYEVAGRSDLDLPVKVQLLLEIGCARLDLPYGFVTDIREDTQYIWQAFGDHEALQPGESSPLEESYCRKTIKAEDLVAWENALDQGWAGDPAYERFGLACYVGAKVTVNGELYGTICFADNRPRPHSFNAGERTFVKLLAQWIGREFERERHLQVMEIRARTDPLTGLVNREEVFNRLDQELERAERYGHTLSLLMLDLDHFKDLNDTYGHLAGDEVLRAFGSLLREHMRDSDVAGRYGGEEFVVIVPHVSLEGAVTMAERFLEKLRNQTIDAGGEELQITCSAGVTEMMSHEERAEELIDRADTALYRAKKRGRDRVETE